MSNVSGGGFEADMAEVRAELAAWRSNPEKERKIPESVWDKATFLSKKHSVQAVSKALKLSYCTLKRRATGGGGCQLHGARVRPAFIEVKPVSATEEPACVIEITKGSGTRLRISMKSADSVDWCRIKEAFLGA